ncbi:MAG: response regulator, partial [Longimicrobiales bacterium]
MASVLLVDDEANIRRMLGGLLEAEGYAVLPAADAEEAVNRLERSEVDVALLDLALPGTYGLDLLETIRERWPAMPVVMMSGRATLGEAVRATKLGAFHFIEKQLSTEAVLLTVAGAVELRR